MSPGRSLDERRTASRQHIRTVTMHTRIKVLLSASGMLVGTALTAANIAGVAGAAAPVTTSASSTPGSSAPGSVASTVPGGTAVTGVPVPGSATQQSFVLGDAATAVVDR